MSTQLAVREDNSIFSNADKFQLAGKMAESLARSTIVPKDFQGNPNNTLVALELANRLQTSPLMVMQNLYVVYGRPSWSAQYMIAMINGSGKYDMELQFDEKVDKNGKPYSCQCWTEKNGRKVTGPVIDMDMARAEGWLNKNGSKWQTMPQIMLRYRAASFFGRMNCPELTLGIYTREEVVEIGPENYQEVQYEQPIQTVEAQVKEDIQQNANSVAFEDVIEESAPAVEEAMPAPEPEPKPEQPKKPGRPKKSEPKPEPVSEPEAVPFEDAPEWA